MARRIIAALLVVLATVLAPFAVIGLWAERTITDTGIFVETIAPLSEDPQVRQVLGTEMTTALVEAVDAEARLTQALGDLSGPLGQLVDTEVVVESLVSGINGAIESRVQSYVQSDRFGELWTAVATDLQRGFVAAINRDTSDAAVTLQEGQLVLDTKVATEKVQADLVARGVPFTDQLDRVPGREVVLADTPGLQTAVDVLSIVLPVASWLWAVVLVLLLVGVLLWPPRSRGLMWAGLGLALAGGLTYLVLELGQASVQATAPGGFGGLVGAMTEILLRFLANALLVLMAIGLAALLGGWLGGGARSGTRVRDMITGPVHRWSTPLADTWLGRFTSEHPMFVPTLRALVIVLGVAWLFATERLTPGRVAWTATAAALGLLLVEVVEGAGRNREAVRSGALVASGAEPLPTQDQPGHA
jgi:hypothetical protein